MSKNIQVEFTPEELRVLVMVLEHNPKAAFVIHQNVGNNGGHVEHAAQTQLTDRLQALIAMEVR